MLLYVLHSKRTGIFVQFVQIARIERPTEIAAVCYVHRCCVIIAIRFKPTAPKTRGLNASTPSGLKAPWPVGLYPPL